MNEVEQKIYEFFVALRDVSNKDALLIQSLSRFRQENPTAQQILNAAREAFPTYHINWREVELGSVIGEVSEGAEAEEANYVDTGEALTEAELEQFNKDYAGELYDEYYQNLVTASEAYYEGDR